MELTSTDAVAWHQIGTDYLRVSPSPLTKFADHAKLLVVSSLYGYCAMGTSTGLTLISPSFPGLLFTLSDHLVDSMHNKQNGSFETGQNCTRVIFSSESLVAVLCLSLDQESILVGLDDDVGSLISISAYMLNESLGSEVTMDVSKPLQTFQMGSRLQDVRVSLVHGCACVVMENYSSMFLQNIEKDGKTRSWREIGSVRDVQVTCGTLAPSTSYKNFRFAFALQSYIIVFKLVGALPNLIAFLE